jgi:hypothetical protein
MGGAHQTALPEGGNVRAGETIIRQAKQQLELINEVVDTWRLLSISSSCRAH